MRGKAVICGDQTREFGDTNADPKRRLALQMMQKPTFVLGFPPAIIWVPAALTALVMILPLGYLVWRTTGSGPDAVDLLMRGKTVAIVIRSVALIVTVTLGSIIISVPIAWLTTRTDLPYKRLWEILTILPLVVPSYVGGFLVVIALGPKGMLQEFLYDLFGVGRLPEIYGFSGAALTLTFLSYPYVLLTVRGALMRLDPSLEETSRSLGRGQWTTFWRITVPLLRPSIAAGSLLVALYTLSDFGAVSILKYETFTWAIYTQYESVFGRHLASMLSLVLVGVALVILLGEQKMRGKQKYYRSGVGVSRPLSVVRLGRWRGAALSFCGGIVMTALGVPMLILAYWAIRGVAAGEPLTLLWSATWNSIYVSMFAAIVSVSLALPLAGLVVRHGGRLSALVEKLTFVGFALPGIVVALALVFLGINVVINIYQTLILLVFGYVMLFLPAALNPLRTSLLQVSPRLEEVARSLGKRPLTVMTTITIPLLWPSLIAGSALVFLLTMKELPVTLILSPPGFTTLATSIWAAASEAFFARAALASLLLILVTAFPLIWFLRKGDQ